MKIIIGLGNPGKKYENTRHNIGFEIIEKIQTKWYFPSFVNEKKFQAEISKEKELVLVKPQTFMNASGEAIRSILDFYKLTPEDIIVIHDDLDIALGEFKIATDSRSAGHNGIQDIIEKLETQKFLRLRIGIGKNENMPSENYVLQQFTQEEKKKIEDIEESIISEIKKLLEKK